MTNPNNQNDKTNTTTPHQDQPRQGAQQDQQQRQQGGLQPQKPDATKAPEAVGNKSPGAEGAKS